MIEFTGERLVPGKVNADLWAEHISRYDYAAQYACGRCVLDIGCGTGYGTALLASTAHSAVGLDFAADAIQHARETYAAPNVIFTQGSATALPYPDQHFNLIVAFEVIEHLEQWRDMLSEARRVLKPDGLFLVSTPNRTYYNAARAEAGANPFHVHEFDYAEFAHALSDYFPHTQILLQNRLDAFAFYPSKTNPSSTTNTSTTAHLGTPHDEPENAYFFLGCCSVTTPPPNQSYIHVAHASNLLRERERHIAALQIQLNQKLSQYAALEQAYTQLQQTLEERTTWATNLGNELQQTQNRVADLQNHLEQQNAWALELERDLTAAREHHAQLNTLFEERTKWALTLDQELKTALQHLTATNTTLEHHRELIQHWQAATAASRWMRLGRKLKLGPQFHTPPSAEDQ